MYKRTRKFLTKEKSTTPINKGLLDKRLTNYCYSSCSERWVFCCWKIDTLHLQYPGFGTMEVKPAQGKRGNVSNNIIAGTSVWSRYVKV